jgi:hypothetical protein
VEWTRAQGDKIGVRELARKAGVSYVALLLGATRRRYNEQNGAEVSEISEKDRERRLGSITRNYAHQSLHVLRRHDDVKRRWASGPVRSGSCQHCMRYCCVTWRDGMTEASRVSGGRRVAAQAGLLEWSAR